MRKGEALFLQGMLNRLALADAVETIYVQRQEASLLHDAGVRVTVGTRPHGETKERTVQVFCAYSTLEADTEPASRGWTRATDALVRLGLA